MPRLLLIAVFCCCSFGSAGCVSGGGDKIVREVDDRTGHSFTRVREPLRLATVQPWLSRVGKDYLLVAPVVVSGTDRNGQYLWLALGTTIDRTITNAAPRQFNRIVLVVDGMPMTFDLEHWQKTASSEPFKVSIKLTDSFSARLTDSQLKRIAGAETLSAYVTNAEHRSPEYGLVHGSPADWLEF